MAVFQYTAIDKASGKKTKGVIDADNAVVARQKLREQDLYPTDIAEGGEVQMAAGGRRKRGGFGGGVPVRDLSLMTRQFATLLHAGMPMVECLNALMEQTTRPRLRQTIFEVRDKVNSGSSLADALADHPKVYSALYVNMVRAGETSGTLEPVLFRLAEILEHQAKLKGQILSTMAYPAFMGFFAVAVIVFLMIVIVPRITMIFEKQEQELPVLTKILIGTSEFIGSYWWLIIGVVIGTMALWRSWIGRPKGRMKWDRMKMRFPLYGTLHVKLVCARFARTLGTMLHSGLTMMRALDVVESVVDNVYIREKLVDIKAGVRRGRDLAVPMKETGLFPPMLIHMVDLGQRSGEIEDMLMRVADTYDEDVRLTIEAIVGLMEPIVIVIMGIFVGFLVMAILLPILNMSTNIGG
jgi:general secretion pathway protein F